jgi:hypothetical protein
MSSIFDRLAGHPQGGGVLRAASAFLATQPDSSARELHGLLCELETMAQRQTPEVFSDTLQALAADDERARAMWGLVHCMWSLRKSEDLARAYGLKVGFVGDLRAVVEGRAPAESLHVAVEITAAGRAAREAAEGEGGAA